MSNYPNIAITTGKEIRFFFPHQIMYCISEGSYTKLQLEGGQTVMASKHLKEIEEILPQEVFVRVHHSHILNLMYASKLIENGEDTIVMVDGTKFQVSRRKISVLMSRFQKI
ncbi:MAG: LytTR family transcriptional regulator [Saprospiraceae bacterium]|nr:LytTR family transcriptional regulator [Saprospiraceae bacterium]